MEALPANELRQVKTLLWALIAEKLHPAERDEVRRVLGSKAVEENNSLFEEAGALAEILGEVRLRQEGAESGRRMFEHPARVMVENEVRMLIDSLKRSAGSSLFVDTKALTEQQETAVPRDSAAERAVFDYVTAGGAAAALAGARPMTPSTPPPRPPSSRGSRPSTAATSMSSCSSLDPNSAVDAAAQSGKLNFLEVDAVKAHLRAALEEEKIALMEDIEYLQLCLEEWTSGGMPDEEMLAPPPLADLQAYGAKLEQRWQAEEARREHEERVQKMLTAEFRSRSRVGKLRGLVGESRSFEERGEEGGGLPSRTPKEEGDGAGRRAGVALTAVRDVGQQAGAEHEALLGVQAEAGAAGAGSGAGAGAEGAASLASRGAGAEDAEGVEGALFSEEAKPAKEGAKGKRGGARGAPPPPAGGMASMFWAAEFGVDPSQAPEDVGRLVNMGAGAGSTALGVSPGAEARDDSRGMAPLPPSGRPPNRSGRVTPPTAVPTGDASGPTH